MSEGKAMTSLEDAKKQMLAILNNPKLEQVVLIAKLAPSESINFLCVDYADQFTRAGAAAALLARAGNALIDPNTEKVGTLQ